MSAALGVTASGLTASAPAAERSGEIWYVRHPLHGHFGPATWETLKRWAAEDRISPESLIWREGWADWRPAPEVLAQSSADGDRSSPRAREALDLDALAAAGGSSAFGAAAQRLAARRKYTQTMRVVSIVLAAAVTLLACILLYVLMRSR
jgi:hypothetical protein